MASLLLRSAFAGRQLAPQVAHVCSTRSTRSTIVAPVQAGRVCELTGTKRNKANTISFSNKKNRKWQYPNLQKKRIYWPTGQRWVTLKLTTRALKTIEQKGLDAMAQEAGIDLWKLPFRDGRLQRKQYVEENKGKVPVAVNPRVMKNPVKLAASKKKPRYPVYEPSGRIVWVRPGTEAEVITWKQSPAAGGTAAGAAAAKASKPELKIAVQE